MTTSFDPVAFQKALLSNTYGFLPRILSGPFNRGASVVFSKTRPIRVTLSNTASQFDLGEVTELATEATLVNDEREFLHHLKSCVSPAIKAQELTRDQILNLGVHARNSHGGNSMIAANLVSRLYQDLAEFYDPSVRQESVTVGDLGMLVGRKLMSDCYRIPEHHVIAPGEMWAFHKELGGLLVTETAPIVTSNETHTTALWYRSLQFSINHADGFAYVTSGPHDDQKQNHHP